MKCCCGKKIKNKDLVIKKSTIEEVAKENPQLAEEIMKFFEEEKNFLADIGYCPNCGNVLKIIIPTTEKKKWKIKMIIN